VTRKWNHWKWRRPSASVNGSSVILTVRTSAVADTSSPLPLSNALLNPYGGGGVCCGGGADAAEDVIAANAEEEDDDATTTTTIGGPRARRDDARGRGVNGGRALWWVADEAATARARLTTRPASCAFTTRASMYRAARSGVTTS